MISFRHIASVICIIFLYSVTSFSQTLNYPESVAYDYQKGIFYVSNKSGKQILTMDENSRLKFYADGFVSPRGLLIYNGFLYVADGAFLKGFNLQTNEMDVNLPISDAMMLNDICADSSGNLYITDTQAMVIFKYTPSTQAVDVLVLQDPINSPNGILYDKATNQLVFVEYTDPAAIVCLDLASKMIVKTVVDPNIKYMDGIVKLPDGKFLVSSWQVMSFDKKMGKIYEWDPNVTGNLKVFAEGYSAPADISLFTLDGFLYLIIPNYMGNQVDFLQLDIKQEVSENSTSSVIEMFPNPSTAKLNIRIKDESKKINTISVYNQLGFSINEIHADASLSYQVDVQNLESGTYYLVIKGNEFTEKRRFIVIK